MRLVTITRDRKILAKLKFCRWLTTSQIQRLFFPGASLDAVRKRLRKLAGARHLQSWQPDRMSEALHGFGKPPAKVAHLGGINDVRITAESEGVEFFYAYWELGEFGWEYPVIPDAVVKTDGQVCLVEYDNGTESNAQLRDKFRKYGCFDFEYTLIVVADTDQRLRKLKKLASMSIEGEVLAQLLGTFR